MCGNNFSIYIVHIPRKCIESIHLYSCPHSPTESYDLLRNIKIQSENIKMARNISLFTFCMIFDFSKCDGFTLLGTSSLQP